METKIVPDALSMEVANFTDIEIENCAEFNSDIDLLHLKIFCKIEKVCEF